jgi:hypothetical protein
MSSRRNRVAASRERADSGYTVIEIGIAVCSVLAACASAHVPLRMTSAHDLCADFCV